MAGAQRVDLKFILFYPFSFLAQRGPQMPTTKVTWVKDKTFVGSDSRNHSVVMSGDGPPRGMSPSELLLVGLAGCTAYDVVEILEKKRKPLSFLEIVTIGEREDDPPWPYRTIHLKYRLAGKGLTEKAVADAIRLSEEKYCSVAATVRGVAKITTEFEIL
jgi:putative redox protein